MTCLGCHYVRQVTRNRADQCSGCYSRDQRWELFVVWGLVVVAFAAVVASYFPEVFS